MQQGLFQESLFQQSLEAGWNTTINLPSYTLAAKHCRELAREFEVRGPRKNGNGWFVFWRPKQKEDVSDMKEQAIAKLRTEMNNNTNNPYVLAIGEFLIRHIEANPHDADKFLAADKTIEKSLKAMETEARARRKGSNMVMLSDAEGFQIVLKYFGAEGTPVVPTITISVTAAPATATAPTVKAPDASPQTASHTETKTDFSVNLSDFF